MASLFSLCFDVLFVVVLCKLLHFHCANFKRKSEQGNEALSIVVIVLIFLYMKSLVHGLIL